MVRLSSQSKSMPISCDAAYSPTGTCTRPKLMAPFQMTLGMWISRMRRADSAVGALRDEVGAALAVDAAIDDRVAAAGRARRRRGFDETAPGGSLARARALARRGRRDAA